MPDTDKRVCTELILWKFVERYGRKGWLTRDFFVGDQRYRWTSNSVHRDGLLRWGILVNDG